MINLATLKEVLFHSFLNKEFFCFFFLLRFSLSLYSLKMNCLGIHFSSTSYIEAEKFCCKDSKYCCSTKICQ